MYDGENLNTGETAETREETGWMKAEGGKAGTVARVDVAGQGWGDRKSVV